MQSTFLQKENKYLLRDLSNASDHCEDSCLNQASILAAVRGITSPYNRSVACRT